MTKNNLRIDRMGRERNGHSLKDLCFGSKVGHYLQAVSKKIYIKLTPNSMEQRECVADCASLQAPYLFQFD